MQSKRLVGYKEKVQASLRATQVPIAFIGVVLGLHMATAARAQPQSVQTAPSSQAQSGVTDDPAQSPNPVPPAGPDGPIQVSAGVMAGNVLRRVNPVYPAEAREQHLQGVVVLQAIVSKTGKIENLRVISGPDLLRQSAIDAAQQWQYKPFLLNGQPVEVQTAIHVNFSIDDSKKLDGQSAATDGMSTPVRNIGGSLLVPVLVHQVPPKFTAESRRAKFKGMVLVNLIVDTKGRPQNVHVLRGVGMGMDENVIKSVKQYRFKPSMEGGKPVPVELNVEVILDVF